MKSLLIGVFSLLMANVCSAHYITPSCNDKGRFKFFASSMPIGKSCTIKFITAGMTWDSTFIVKSSSFSFTVPLLNPTQPRQISVKTSDGYTATAWTNSKTCTALPLKFESFTAAKLDDQRVLLTVTVSDVYDVKELRFTCSLDGQNFIVVGTITPDNQNFVKTYTATVDLSKPLNSTK